MKNNQNIIKNVYWVNINLREAYRDDPDVRSYSGRLLVSQIEKAQIPAVDLAEFVASWNRVCPFTTRGEKWACFEQNSEIPLAVVARYSAETYRIRTIYNTWFSPYSAVNMIKVSEKSIPFPDAARGCWKIDLVPYRGEGSETASLYVEYISHTIYFTFDSCYSIEHGMLHFVDYPFTLKEQHEESEFSSREQLIQCLVDFLPNLRRSKTSTVPPGNCISFDDIQLYELLAYYIAASDKKTQNSSFPEKKTELNPWEEYVAYYNKYYINWEKPYRRILHHSEKIHLTRLRDFIPIDRLADECISLDDFIFAIGKEMSNAGACINKEKNDNRNEYYRREYEYFTFFEYSLDRINNSYSISPEEAAWFYLLLNRDKAAKLLDDSQTEKLNSLLASAYSEIENRREIPESCMAKLLVLRKVFTDPECTVFNWDYAISNALCKGDRKDTIANFYAYHMGCSAETAMEETEKALSKAIDPKLKACYPGWEIEVALNKIYMRKRFKDLSLEDWLGFEHPFFREHSKNPADSARHFYKICSSGWWNFPEELHGYIDRIDSYLSENMMEETPDKLVLWHDKSTERNPKEGATLKLEFVSDNPNDTSVNTGYCGVPCKGWYDRGGRRYLLDPLGMTGLFEFCDTSMKYDELKRRIIEEGLTECCNVRFDVLAGGYNTVCIARQNGTFTVNFCDERGEPFSEHRGLSETEACEMVYSHAVTEKHLQEFYKAKNASSTANSDGSNFSGSGIVDQPLQSEIASKATDQHEDVISRLISRILNVMGVDTILTVILILVIIILVVIYRLLWRLLASKKLAAFVLLGLILGFVVVLRFYFRKKRSGHRNSSSHRTKL